MHRITVSTLLTLALAGRALAQGDTSVYYLRSFGATVMTRDDADYYEIIYPSKNPADSGLFVVKQLYKDGKLRSEGLSQRNAAHPRLQGLYTVYFANSNKLMVKHYTAGKQDGEETAYYPNGKFYYSKTYTAGGSSIKECRDSSGNVLAKDGNGKMIFYSGDHFYDNALEGPIVNGRQDGEWRGKIRDTLSFVTKYKNGEEKWSYHIGRDGQISYWAVEKMPSFPGGINGLYQFLSQNITYPIVARQNNIQGRVIITFIVDADGKLKDIKVARGIGGGCDEEAVRVLKLSPPWTPGIVEDKPVPVQFSVPISFTLSK